jgi:hypothetical protein
MSDADSIVIVSIGSHILRLTIVIGVMPMRKLLLWVLALTCASAIAQTQPETRSGSIVVGQPTQDNKGPGSINAQSIYVNGVAVGTGGGTVTTSGTPASGNIAAFSSPNAITPATAAQVTGLWTGTGSGSNCLGGNGALIACGGTVGSGTAGQVAVYSSPGTAVAGSSTLPAGVTIPSGIATNMAAGVVTSTGSQLGSATSLPAVVTGAVAPTFSIGTGLFPALANTTGATGTFSAGANTTFTCTASCGNFYVGASLNGSDSSSNNIFPAEGGEVAAVITGISGSTITINIPTNAATVAGTYSVYIGQTRMSTTSTSYANTGAFQNVFAGGAAQNNSVWSDNYLAFGCTTTSTVQCLLSGGSGASPSQTRVSLIGARSSDTTGSALEANTLLTVNDDVTIHLGTITGGTGYDGGGSGTFSGVALTGGSGTGAIATITVTSGVVTAVTVTASPSGYLRADTLSATTIGAAGGSGFAVPISAIGKTGSMWGSYWQTEVLPFAGQSDLNFAIESTVFNFGSQTQSDPFTVNKVGGTYNFRLDCGQVPQPYSPQYNCDTALQILGLDGYSQETGIMFGSSALDTTTLAHPPALALPSGANGYSLAWYKAAGYNTPAWQIYATDTTINGHYFALNNSSITTDVDIDPASVCAAAACPGAFTTLSSTSVPTVNNLQLPSVLLQSGIPFIVPPSSFMANNGVFVIGQTPSATATATFSATSGTGVTMTLSSADLLGTSADVGRVLTILDTTYKYATITALGTTSTATVTITGTLSGTGPFANSAIWLTGSPTSTNATGYSVSLPRAVPGAYAYFPAGAISSGSNAGWYWTVMSSTTVGTAYNSVYSSGKPAVGTTTAFSTTGPGAFTQTTGAYIAGPQATVAAGAMGLNGTIQGSYTGSVNSTANNKVFIPELNGLKVGQMNLSSVTGASSTPFAVTNQGTASAQIYNPGNGLSGQYSNSTGGVTITSINTASAQTFAFAMNLATATDYMILEQYTAELLPN